MKTLALAIATLLAACSAPSDRAPVSAPTGADPHAAPGLALGALDGDLRTIPYGGYVDFDGEPVNAGAVGFNFVIFPCATPGTGAGGCNALWVAKGAWTNAATWTDGWPAGAGNEVDLPIFSGRFAVELGGAGQNPLPDAVFDTGGEPLYLGVRVEGRALGALQKIVPTTRTHTAARAELADHALVADMVGDLDPEEIATRRSWATSGEVAPGGALELQTFGDATDAEVFVWERRGQEWIAIDPEGGFIGDPALYGYYPFDETSGSQVLDASGQGHHLSLGGGVHTLGVPGAIGPGIRFGGSGPSGGNTASTSSFGMPFASGLTLALWLNPIELDRDIHFLTLHRDGSGHDAYLSFYPPSCGGNQLALRSSTEARCGLTRVQSNDVWMHVAAIYNPATNQVRFYVNGEWDGVSSDLNLPGITSTVVMNYLGIGRRFTGGGYDYIGRMDEVAIFNRMLKADEIARLYAHGVRSGYTLTRTPEGLVRVTNDTGTNRNLRLLVVK